MAITKSKHKRVQMKHAQRAKRQVEELQEGSR